MRLLSGGGVLLLHVLVAIALLLQYRAVRLPAAPDRPMLLLKLKSETPALEVKPVAPPRPITPPSSTLVSPVFTLSPAERRPLAVPEPAAPAAPGVGAPAAPPKPGDLFSDEKKAEFKRFFKQQAIEDARENAKAGGRDGCEIFRDKPGELPKVDMQASNGITRDFVPAFGVGTQTSGDDKGHMQACN
jgi:hypothetical protein